MFAKLPLYQLYQLNSFIYDLTIPFLKTATYKILSFDICGEYKFIVKM